MAIEVALLLRQAINAVQLWFTQIFSATGMTGFYLSLVFIYLLVRILLSNFLPSSGSDTGVKSLPPGRSKKNKDG